LQRYPKTGYVFCNGENRAPVPNTGKLLDEPKKWRSVFSAVDGTVQQIYFRPGEMVPAGRPVLSLLPPGNIKVRFYLPETVLPAIAYGDEIKVSCDGCASGLTARVSFIAKQSEFTPPVIYSLEERAKLVFLIEALPEKP